MIDRRDFLVGTAATLASPIAAKEQAPDGTARVGFLNLGGGEPRMRAAFLQGLRDLGYVEGRNLLIEIRDAEANRRGFPRSPLNSLRERSTSS